MKDMVMAADKRRFDKLVSKLYQDYEKIALPPEYAYFVKDNLLRLLIRLARYKFVARMLRPYDSVIEIGCGSGLGAIFMSQHCRSVKGVDTNSHEISEAESINRRDNVSFDTIDFLKYPKRLKHDVVVALDVIEHMNKSEGRKLLACAARHMPGSGMFIVGTPSRYSYEYQGELSKTAHIKLYDQQELVEEMEKYFGRVIAFSMNDELVHTGFSKMAWYYFVIGFMPKRRFK